MVFQWLNNYWYKKKLFVLEEEYTDICIIDNNRENEWANIFLKYHESQAILQGNHKKEHENDNSSKSEIIILDDIPKKKLTDNDKQKKIVEYLKVEKLFVPKKNKDKNNMTKKTANLEKKLVQKKLDSYLSKIQNADSASDNTLNSNGCTKSQLTKKKRKRNRKNRKEKITEAKITPQSIGLAEIELDCLLTSMAGLGLDYQRGISMYKHFGPYSIHANSR